MAANAVGKAVTAIAKRSGILTERKFVDDCLQGFKDYSRAALSALYGEQRLTRLNRAIAAFGRQWQ